jgi:histidyl-tRNA synthetase
MIKKIRGVQDIYGDKAKEYDYLISYLEKIITSYNFHKIITPAIEFKSLYYQKEIDNKEEEFDELITKEMYQFQDKKKRFLVLKPDGTYGFVRFVLENNFHNKKLLPLKNYYIDKMFRYERPQRGRLREFYQFGVEIVGSDQIFLDLELIFLINQIQEEMKIKDLTILQINYFGSWKTKNEYKQKLKLYFQKKEIMLCSLCLKRLSSNNLLRIIECLICFDKFKNLPKLSEIYQEKEKIFFQKLINYLNLFKINYQINPFLVRGLTYYTGIVFELLTKKDQNLDLNNKSLLGGGRYDNLFQKVDQKVSLTASGFGIGIERLWLLLSSRTNFLKKDFYLDLYILFLLKKNEDKEDLYFFTHQLIFDLRKKNLKIDCNYQEKKLKSQYKKAKIFRAKFTTIIGKEEMESKEIKLENQLTKEIKIIKIFDLSNYLINN